MSDPFKILGVPPRYDLDEHDLHKRFIQASAAAHPDRLTDPLDQADAAARSAVINDAYRLLKDPELRANALLEVLGGLAKEADPSLPADLLMEVMDAREQMEQAVASGDQAAVNHWADWAGRQRREHLQRIAQLFDQARSGPQEDLDRLLKQIRLELNALRYFQRMIDQAPGQ